MPLMLIELKSNKLLIELYIQQLNNGLMEREAACLAAAAQKNYSSND